MNILSYLFLLVFYGNNKVECKNNFDCRNSSSCIDGVIKCICYNKKCYFE